MWSADANRWHCSQVPYKSSCFTKPCCAPESARSTGAALPLLAKFSAPQSQQKSHWLINPKPHMVDFQVYLDPLTCKVLLALTSLCRPVSETRTWSYTSILSMRSSTSKLPCERALNEFFLMRSQGFLTMLHASYYRYDTWCYCDECDECDACWSLTKCWFSEVTNLDQAFLECLPHQGNSPDLHTACSSLFSLHKDIWRNIKNINRNQYCGDVILSLRNRGS